MLATRINTGELVVNTEKLDLWLSGFFSRLESYARNTSCTSEIKKRAIGALAGLVIECLGEHVSCTITANADATGGVGTGYVCHLSVDESNMCLSLALAAFERGQSLPSLPNKKCCNNS